MSFSEWREVKLGDISDFAKGRISISEINVENYVSTDNMLPDKGGKVIASSLPITKNVLRYSKEQTLISNIRPYFKKIWFANTNGGCSSDVLVFKLTGKVAPKYFYYCLSQDSFFDYVMAGSKGTKMPRGDKQQIMMYPLLLPPLDEQKAIAATLSCLDDKIELNNRINKNLEEIAQAIFKSWFVDFEPFQDGEFEDSELGRIPKGWRVGKIEEYAKCELGGTPSRTKEEYWNGDIPWINSGKTNEFRITQPSEYITELGLASSSTKLLPAKTTVVAITGATLGQVSLLEIQSCTNQSVVGILENELVPYEFIYPLT